MPRGHAFAVGLITQNEVILIRIQPGKSVSHCYDQKIIRVLKTSHIQILSGIFPTQAISDAHGEIAAG